MSESVMKLRSVAVVYTFDIQDDYGLEFSVFRRFCEHETRGEIEVGLDEVGDNLSYEQMTLMAQIVGEEAARLGKINPAKYSTKNFYDRKTGV